jgi:ERF superfamily
MTSLIYQKMIEAQRLFGKGGIEKKDRNKFQNFNYRSVDSTIASANLVLSSVGIICIPSSSQSVWSTRETKDKSGNPRIDYTLQTEYTFTFYAEDGSFVEAKSLPTANTTQDDSKLLGQTLSYAYKEVLFKTFSIPVEGIEDVDSMDANRNQPPVLSKPLGSNLPGESPDAPLPEFNEEVLGIAKKSPALVHVEKTRPTPEASKRYGQVAKNDPLSAQRKLDQSMPVFGRDGDELPF